MAKYRNNTTGVVEEIGNPELNPQLTAGKTLVPDTSATGSIITSDITQPQTPINYQTYNGGPVDVSGITLTPTQQQAQQETTDLQALIGQLGGESAYTAEQETAQGLAEKERVANEQATIVKNLQLEVKAIIDLLFGYR